MSLNASILNTSDQSAFLVESVFEESTFNNNLNLSKLELSHISTNGTTIQDTSDHLSNEPISAANLSITMDQREQEHLRNNFRKARVNSSTMDLSPSMNGTLEQATTSKKSRNTTIAKVSMDTEILENGDDDDDSVIPVDDDIEEVSTLENAEEETHKTIEIDMFSHLQPNKTSNTTNELQESIQEQDLEISILEQSSMENLKMQSSDKDESQMEHSQLDKSQMEESQMQQSHMDKSQMEESQLQQSHMVESQMEQSHIQTSQLELLSIMDEESSKYLPDETNLFQYPFIEIGRRLWPSNAQKQHYTKGCLWSPDGTCLLVPVHLDGMHIVELPTDLYTTQELNVERNISELNSAVHVKEGGTVYDCCWYPYMNSTDPATCCWLATRQHEPIHMWDAFSGDLRCSYRGYDDVDEVESAISIIFSNDAEKVIGGYKKNIKIFDTNIPGRKCVSLPVKQAVSCFALTTDNDNCVTAGTWAGYINHYDLRSPKLGALFTLGGHTGGITWLKYSPTHDQSWYLFSGARKDNKILQWDMRNYTEPVQIFERNVHTNQRIYFDLTPLHMWLATGDTEGLVKIWNLGDKEQFYKLPLHTDCCNGISFHPSFPILSTSSGQYHFIDVTEDDNKKAVNEMVKEKTINYENSLLFLWYGRSTEV